MSTLWTPSGEHPIGDRRSSGAQAPERGPAEEGPARARKRPPGGEEGPPGAEEGPLGAEEGLPGSTAGRAGAAEAEELRRQLAGTPPEVVVANHCYGLFELAAIYLSQAPPLLEQARLAIDALGALVEGLNGRLGDVEPSLRDALAQLRLGYVQMGAAHAPPSTTDGDGDGSQEAVS